MQTIDATSRFIKGKMLFHFLNFITVKKCRKINLSDKFWQQFKILNENHRKQMGLQN